VSDRGPQFVSKF
jgi:hypothetical protein